ncbi:MAG: hypothetical protein WBO29_12955 [Albidovulum sp.]
MPKIEIENILHPGSSRRVDEGKYLAMRAAYLSVLPTTEPGLAPAEVQKCVVPLLPAALFPNGEKAGWWAKAVQLDLEAKGLAIRSIGSPVRLRRA